jgi:hypothetical protein
MGMRKITYSMHSIQFNSILFMFHNIHNRPGLTGKVTTDLSKDTHFLVEYISEKGHSEDRGIEIYSLYMYI